VLGYRRMPRTEVDPPGSQTINKVRVQPVIDRWTEPANVERALVELAIPGTGTFPVLEVTTPDEDTNRMVNIWNPYQCMTTFNLSRSMSSYESGIGRGMDL